MDIEAQLDLAKTLLDKRNPEKKNREAHIVEQKRKFHRLRMLLGFTETPPQREDHVHTPEECEFVIQHYLHECADDACDKTRNIHTPPHQCVEWSFESEQGCINNTLKLSESASLFGCLKSGHVHQCERDMKVCPNYEDHEFNVICLYSGYNIGKAEQRVTTNFSYARSTSSGGGGGGGNNNNTSPVSAGSGGGGGGGGGGTATVNPADKLQASCIADVDDDAATATTATRRRRRRGVIRTLAPNNHASTERIQRDLIQVREILRLLFDEAQTMPTEILRRSTIELCVNTQPEMVAVLLEIQRNSKWYQRNREYHVERYARACMSLWQSLSLIRVSSAATATATTGGHLLSNATMLTFVLGFIYLLKSGFSDKSCAGKLSPRDPFLSANLPPEMKFRTKHRSVNGASTQTSTSRKQRTMRMRTNSSRSASAGAGVNTRRRSAAVRRHGKESRSWLAEDYLIDSHCDATFIETQLRATQTKRRRRNVPSAARTRTTTRRRRRRISPKKEIQSRAPDTGTATGGAGGIPYEKSDITIGKTIVKKAISRIDDQQLRLHIFQNIRDEVHRE